MAGRTYHHGDLRQAILDEARDQVESKGVAAFSLAAVAASLGVSSGAPYHHFRDKRDVLESIGEQVFTELLQVMGGATREALGGAPVNRAKLQAALRAGAHEFLQYSLDHPVLFRMSLTEYRPSPDSAAFTLGGEVTREGATLLVSAGMVDAVRVAEFGAAVYVALRGVAAVAEETPRLVPQATEPHTLLDQMLDALFRAFAP